METSKAEHQAGVNISYENSFTAIKRDILKETVNKHRSIAQQIKADSKLKAPIPKAIAPKKAKEEEIKDEEEEEFGDATPNKPKSIDFSGTETKSGSKTFDRKIPTSSSKKQSTISYNTARGDSKLSTSLYNRTTSRGTPKSSSKVNKSIDEKISRPVNQRRKTGNYNTMKPSEIRTSNTSRIPIEPSIPKPSITPKSRMMKPKQRSPLNGKINSSIDHSVGSKLMTGTPTGKAAHGKSFNSGSVNSSRVSKYGRV